MRSCCVGLVVVCAVACAGALLLGGGCSPRMIKALAKASANGNSQKGSGSTPGYQIEPLPDDNRPIFNEDREWTPRIYRRYAEAMGDTKDIKCIDRAIAAWQQDVSWDKPKPERMAFTFSTLFNDLKGKKLGLSWVVFRDNGTTVILATKDHQTLVFIDQIMLDWVNGKKRGYSTDKLVEEITEALNSGSKEPTLLGLSEQ